MGIEIERKFLVADDGWRDDVRSSRRIAQGYISTEPERTVRVRITGQTGLLTIKGRAEQLVRAEYEYEIPADEARMLLDDFCSPRAIEKVRHEVDVGDHLWEIDVFEGANKGLVLAEVELQSPDESFEIPPWVGDEVTGEVRYYNSRLVDNPVAQWDD